MIENYEFVDCVLTNFFVENNMQSLELITEACYPIENNNLQRKKGLLKISAHEIQSIKAEISSEFYSDIKIEYSKDGDDTKSNEVYQIEVKELDNSKFRLLVVSDFIQIDVISSKLVILNL